MKYSHRLFSYFVAAAATLLTAKSYSATFEDFRNPIAVYSAWEEGPSVTLSKGLSTLGPTAAFCQSRHLGDPEVVVNLEIRLHLFTPFQSPSSCQILKIQMAKSTPTMGIHLKPELKV